MVVFYYTNNYPNEKLMVNDTNITPVSQKIPSPPYEGLDTYLRNKILGFWHVKPKS